MSSPLPASRRDFVKTAAVASIGAILGRSALRAESGGSVVAPARWGVIGCGKRALRAHFPGILALPGMEILGVCDVMADHLRQGVAAAGGKAQAYEDYQKLLANPNIDTVVIATPDFLHCEMVVAALQAGKHVMCEKPMGIDITQGNAMKKAAAASDRTVLYTTQLPYSLYYQEIKKQIDSGRIGRPRHLLYRLYRGDWAANGWLYTDPKTGRKINWRLSQAASGGPLVEEGCHYLELLNWMAGGLPQRVQCTGNIAVYRDGRDTWDQAVTTLTYEDGCIGLLDLSLFGPNQLEFHILGESGTLHADVDAHKLYLEPLKRAEHREDIPVPEEIAHGIHGPKNGPETAVTEMYHDFIDCIRTHREPRVDSATVFSACKTAWLGNLSAKEHREVSWNDLS